MTDLSPTRWRIVALAAVIGWPAFTGAQSDPQPAADPQPPPSVDAEPPPLPPKKTPRERLDEPTVQIRRDDEGKLIEEYSLDGRVYMVKVTPENAPPYYLLDTDGDGTLERDTTGLGPGVDPVYWKLKEWD